MQQFFGRGEIAAAWHEFHVPLIGFGVAALLCLAGARLRSALMLVLAGGGAVLVCWWMAIRPSFPFAPHTLAERLVVVAGVGLLVALAAERFAARRGAWPPLILTALVCGWWMAGGARSWSGMLGAAPMELAVVLAILAFAWLSALGNAAAEPLRPWLAAATLAFALHVVGAPRIWVLVALAPAAALLPLLAVRALPAMALLPLAADVAAAQVAVSLSAGRLGRGGLTAVDAAALSPLLALWLYPLAAGRLSRAGRLGPWLGALAAGGMAVGATWVVMRFRR